MDDRRAASLGMQEGVYAAGSFEVTQRAAGANLSVDIAASTHENGIAALVQGDSVSGQGLYVVGPHSAVINEAIASAHATLPRIDRVVLEAQDNLHDASGANAARVRVISGTATAGATLDNLTGAAAVPSNCLLLADVLVAATDTAISNSEIRDRRKWARGAFYSVTRTAGDYTTSSVPMVAVDSTNLNPRIECSGAPVEITLTTTAQHSSAVAAIILGFAVDTVVQDQVSSGIAVASEEFIVCTSWVFTPAAGSHRIAPYWAGGAATATLRANASQQLVYTVRELPRQNMANNVTTTG